MKKEKLLWQLNFKTIAVYYAKQSVRILKKKKYRRNLETEAKRQNINKILWSQAEQTPLWCE